MTSPSFSQLLLPCATTSSLLVVSDCDVHIRKRNRIIEKVIEKAATADKAVIVIQTENKKFGPDCKGASVVNLGGDGDDAGLKSALADALSKTKSSATTVVFHSLSTMLLRNSAVDLARILNDCMGNPCVERVIAAHEGDERLQGVQHLFQTIVSVSGLPGSAVRLRCLVKHRPSAGKPSTKCAVLELAAKGGITVVEDKVANVADADPMKVRSFGAGGSADEKENMNKLTTFNLELSEREKEARNKVDMPFWKPEQKATAAAAREEAGGDEDAVRINSKSGDATRGMIYYEPDDGDDWDDEDPDDDLDF